MKNFLGNRKREQKTSLFLHEISSIIQRLSYDEPDLLKVFVTKIELSKDYKICYVYFSTYADKSDFDKALEILKLYKPSIRRALAQNISGKFAADLRFLYDKTKDKERELLSFLDKVVEQDAQLEVEGEIVDQEAESKDR
ncbi:30S ribosome-binding factor RbfA [Candidatus Babeliales bacterium]|nr:30S ribosome-binding factor RbfA [Candidatus Babeliales bacterium]MCF7899658.1 30S ribosome-binding factor RbfA [Candidatus Babeliales bacterium]